MSRARSCGHGFSIELSSRENLKRIAIMSGSSNRVLVEGLLGELMEISLVEGLMLEVKCSKGILRIDMTEDELVSALRKPSQFK